MCRAHATGKGKSSNKAIVRCELVRFVLLVSRAQAVAP